MSKSKMILIVDDDPDFRESIRIILEVSGYQTDMASNGREAMECLQSRKPDLMILDIMMTTDTEGFDLAFELKNSEQYKDLPIILLTGFLEKVREEGPDEYQHILGEQWPAKWLFEKPVDHHRLLNKVADILSDG